MMTLAMAMDTASHYSLFVRQQLQCYPNLLTEDDLLPMSETQMRTRLQQAMLLATDADVLMQVLRQFRRWQMVRIAVRDLAGLADVQSTLLETSAMADMLIQAAYHWSFDQQVAKWGTPIGDDTGRAQQLIVLAMGKLGGQELNYSSDIDLIYVFPEKGETQGGRLAITNDEFFTKVAQQLTQLLNQSTADGFVFRVDLMLRPFGASGQIVHSFGAFEQYYQLHGRPWERYAMVKARAVTGLVDDVAELEAMLRPFVYRRYVDFSMLSSLRELKQMIALEVTKQGRQQDIKLGSGGIREVEFIVQSFQLIHGGQDVRLRGRSLLKVLHSLVDCQHLPVAVVVELEAAYLFLRAVENRLQMWADQQTHRLPEDEARLRLLAKSLGFVDSDAFMQRLSQHRDLIADHFAEVLGAESCAPVDDWLLVWQQPDIAPFSVNIEDEADWRVQLAAMHHSRRVLSLSSEARRRLDAVMPLLLAELAQRDSCAQTLKRVLPVVKTIMNRSAYLVLLQENQVARRHLVELCAASPWLANYLVEQPALLDQLLDERVLYEPLSKSLLQAELALQCHEDLDEEEFMELIRRFKHAQVFRVAASDIMGKLPLMKVSDYLTWLAEVIVEQTMRFAWRLSVEKYGYLQDSQDDDLPIVIIAFGKLGGIELGYASDLDLVYLVDPDLDLQAMTQGKRQLDHASFIMRLVQKINGLLSLNSLSGIAYEVDMQLRPHGASGALVPSLSGFFRYEHEQAWTWEHQALIRARALAGKATLIASFEAQRLAFLQQPRAMECLAGEVVGMREKMRQHVDKTQGDAFDLKQGIGGLVDIEFLVQYWVLAHAHKTEAIAYYSDHIRQLEALVAAKVITDTVGDWLMDAYRYYRQLAHRQALAEHQTHLVDKQQLQDYPAKVVALWQQVFVGIDARQIGVHC